MSISIEEGTKRVKKNLRSGYTTGACAAAAAKAATLLVTGNESRVTSVDIPFPDGGRVKFKIHNSKLLTHDPQSSAWASVIKDAGDDPDVTNGTEIVAEVSILNDQETGTNGETERLSYSFSPRPRVPASPFLKIKCGKGVGIVTRPGLSVPVGEPAINPVPRQMIKEAVMEAINQSTEHGTQNTDVIEITISVPDGEELAKKTLNSRLGIIGGISILGTTGIVKPVSTEAWTATITSSMDVAVATGQKEIVLSAGRTSEKAHMKKYGLPEESYVLMGDYLEYSLQEAKKHDFRKIHVCAQWAKMVKIAMATPQTHVRFGAIDIKKAVEFLNSLGINAPSDQEFNTAREIFDYIIAGNAGAGHALPTEKVCNAAKKYAEEIAKGIPVITYLVSYDREIITNS
ncbi:MAG TPA: cobalt-precorrin-5B (C(1))-methyltransferase [Nitrospirae bacterium]|nr:cobalt-precorrin-5B (C(1))-methyltransferase [Nitrospirota bacterium]